ncbi:hypothetical protein QJS10_CPB17g00311 [Acorus calamus]|uniref:Uncharacterized protein n=1 Tax=Acorus calamus TaxID=4465 RepID=A0AAV9CWW9_ACOCL|nr:hypothetical protein QJS10_CPB17g00311 [Acorus calamus]
MRECGKRRRSFDRGCRCRENPRVWGFFGGLGSDACPGGLGRIVFSEGVRVWFLVEAPDSGSRGFKGEQVKGG